jgi:hypothetical protein
MRRAGNDAPEPCKSTANAGDPVTKPNASASDATFAIFEILNLFPFLGIGMNYKEKICLRYERRPLDG